MKAKRIFSLFLVLVLMFGIGGSIVLAAETGADMNASSQGQQETEQSAEGGGGETLPSVEVTNPPVPEVTNPPVPEVTNPPAPEATAAPVETSAPTEAPEIGPPGMDGPGIEGPWGDGVFVGDNNPSIDEIYSAASGSATISVQGCYDSSGSVIKYYSSFYYDGRYVGGNGSARHILYANGSPAYCLEPGKYLVGGSVVSTSAASLWNSYSTEKRDAIKMSLLCGVEGNSNSLSGSYGSKYTATQMVMWEFIVGCRNTYPPYTCTDTKVIDSVCGGGWNSEVKTVYNQIVSTMQNYGTLPSFANSTNAPPSSHQMTFQGGVYTVTLNDTNNVLSNFVFSSTNSDLRFNVSGSNLTITATSAVDEATVNVSRKNAVSASSTITAYGGTDLQETIIGIEATSNTSGWFTVSAEPQTPPPTTSTATLAIRKTADDGNVANIEFTLVGIGGEASNAFYSVYTNNVGNVIQEVKPGTYMVTEQTPRGYVATPKSQQVTLEAGNAKVLTFHNSLEKGTVEIIKTSSDNVVGGIKFTISGPDGSQTVTTGSDGTISVPNLSPGSYTVTEQVPAGYTADQITQQFTLMPGELYEVDFHNTLGKGNLKIVKTSDDGIVNGIKFNIVGTDYNHAFSTDSKGVLNVVGLTPGTYTVTEQVPAGYTADRTSQTVTIKAGQLTEVDFHNSLQKGNLKIVKTSDDGIVNGIKFNIVGTDYNHTFSTDSKGVLNVVGLMPGEYTVIEQVPAGYVADNPSQTVTIQAGTLTTVNFHNAPAKGNIKIIKTSDDGNVSGIMMTITGEGYNKSYPTDAKGVLNVGGLTPGTYTVTEQVPAGYTADNPSQTVTIQGGALTTVNFHNSRSVGGIKIVKESDDGNVSGIQFRVQGEGVDQNVTTSSDGTINVPGLVVGEYTVTEIVPEGYVADNATQTVTVRANDSVSVFFKNTPKQWRVAVTKVDAEPGVRRSTRITLEGAQYGVYKDGTLRDTYTTDAHGQFTTNYYPCGTGWTLQEITAPPGYTVDSVSYPIGLAPGSAQLAINETELTVPEEVIKGKLSITKQDANTKTPLEGALFRVFDEDGATVTEGTTGADGTFTVEELPFGIYTAQEITPPSGYMLDDTTFDFAVELDGQEIRITRDDYPAIGSITVHKMDSQGTNLSGAGYLLEYSVDGSGWMPVSFRQDNMAVAGGCTSLGLQNGQLITGDDGVAFFDGLLADGRIQYRLTETQAPVGLSLLKDPLYVGTLPAQGESEAEYDIAFTVTNNRVTTLPQTGGNGMLWPAAIGTVLLGLTMCAGAYFITKKMRKENH